ncbi:Zn-dependent M28 family amino/carboxypeptidase [Arthrobacter ginsengisoli]|uniref:Zn-dependent M28 family amino/carboxypeptidase n=1 Tax=Arthrobacter ginsengisoli TaxID=1356565 RepID=A0ABU1UFH9_9MICC|nr:M20/M25/M40 family metallo-hydrolase [Arthrobacter ginsengisoli]MDR7083918.1 Zn-dependent M28 family amino/carboxypeptidase [Arthrobacter ginsengisoli]
MRHTRNIQRVAIAAAIGLTVSFAPPARAATATGSDALRSAVSAENIIDHLEALQGIADDNGGNRAAGTPGYEASLVYIEEQLDAAGYDPVRQPFTYDRYDFVSASLERVSPNPTSYVYGEGFRDLSYSGAGDVTAPLTAVDVNLAGDHASTSGCEAADFVGFPAGNVALIQRGTCSFRIKADNAAAARASAVIIFNQGNVVPGDDRAGLFGGTLDLPQAAIPVVSTSYATGAELAGLSGVEMHVAVDAGVASIDSYNILADTAGRADRTVVVGAHLDSVGVGPGINDNGSGSAAILETAIQMMESGIEPTNRVRFAFWGGEEDGLVGSDYYVSQLTAQQLTDHAVNLNFDMVGSPNFVRFVYDGDGSAFGAVGPNGSALVEKVFLDYFQSQNLPVAPTAFDGRSDYFGFINNGIPAGGLFTGAEGIKTAEETQIFGGTAGAAYDACYHAACDDIDNLDAGVLEEMADAIAHSTLTFAMTSAVNETAQGKAAGNVDLQYKADKLLK